MPVVVLATNPADCKLEAALTHAHTVKSAQAFIHTQSNMQYSGLSLLGDMKLNIGLYGEF